MIISAIGLHESWIINSRTFPVEVAPEKAAKGMAACNISLHNPYCHALRQREWPGFCRLFAVCFGKN